MNVRLSSKLAKSSRAARSTGAATWALGVAGISIVAAVGTLWAQSPAVRVATPGVTQTPVFQSKLSEFPGKTVTVFSAVFEPGASTPLHQHTGTEFLYVLEGSGVVEQQGRAP